MTFNLHGSTKQSPLISATCISGKIVSYTQKTQKITDYALKMMIRRVKSLSPLLNTRFVVAQQALVRPAPIAIRQFSINTIFKQQEEAQEEIVAKQFITPDFYFKDKRELNKIFIGTMDSIVRSITQEENYVPHNIPEFILGKADLRFKVRMSHFAFFFHIYFLGSNDEVDELCVNESENVRETMKLYMFGRVFVWFFVSLNDNKMSKLFFFMCARKKMCC